MRVLVFFLILIIVSHKGSTQTDSLHSFPKILKRGIYKTYTEFVNNSPSVTDSFNVILIKKNQKDSSIVAAKYELQDPKSVPGSWGFSNGNSVYVSIPYSLKSGIFWKLESFRKQPFLSYPYKNIVLGPGLVGVLTGLATATGTPEYEVAIINSRGKPQTVNIKLMKTLLAGQPALLKSFLKDIEPYDVYVNVDTDPRELDEINNKAKQVMHSYLLQLNEAGEQ